MAHQILNGRAIGTGPGSFELRGSSWETSDASVIIHYEYHLSVFSNEFEDLANCHIHL